MRPFLALAAAAVLAACAPAVTAPGAAFGFTPLPVTRQMALRDSWLASRHALLLEMMRRHGVTMWIVVNEEFHDDPLTAWVAPAKPYAGGRDIFVFVDTGAAGLRRVAVTGFWEESVARFFETAEDPPKQTDALAELYKTVQPQTIALSIDGRRGVTRSLTRETYKFLVEAMGPEAEKHFVPAEPLIIEYLDTRLPGEVEPYREMVRLTDAMVREAFSPRVIHPGVTTVGDVRRFLYDALGRAGVTTWFQPDLRVQRRGAAKASSRGFLAVAHEDVVIQRGDLLHVDFGVTYLGLHTDFQRMAYVLRDGEKEAPAGLRAALANVNALQDAVATMSRPGKLSADVYDEVMAAMKARGIEAMVYSHPLGAQGHALGAAIDFRSAQRKERAAPLRARSWLAMELNAATPVAEWDGQKVFIMEEDPVQLTDDGWQTFIPRQEAFLLVR